MEKNEWTVTMRMPAPHFDENELDQLEFSFHQNTSGIAVAIMGEGADAKLQATFQTSIDKDATIWKVLTNVAWLLQAGIEGVGEVPLSDSAIEYVEVRRGGPEA